MGMFSTALLFKSYSDHPADAHLRIVLHRSDLKGELVTHVENMAEGCKGFGWGHYHGKELTPEVLADFNARGVPSNFTVREVELMIENKEQTARLVKIIKQQTFALNAVLALAILPRTATEEIAKYAALGEPFEAFE